MNVKQPVLRLIICKGWIKEIEQNLYLFQLLQINRKRYKNNKYKKKNKIINKILLLALSVDIFAIVESARESASLIRSSTFSPNFCCLCSVLTNTTKQIFEKKKIFVLYQIVKKQNNKHTIIHCSASANILRTTWLCRRELLAMLSVFVLCCLPFLPDPFSPPLQISLHKW